MSLLAEYISAAKRQVSTVSRNIDAVESRWSDLTDSKIEPRSSTNNDVITTVLNTISALFLAGTILAGVSVLFCGSIRQSGSEKVGVFCTNFWVGFLQIILAPFLVGWIWSIIWGVLIITASGGLCSIMMTQQK